MPTGAHKRKLTDAQILSIFFDKRKGKVVAFEYGVGEALVSAIRKGRIHQNITDKRLKNRRTVLEQKIIDLLEESKKTYLRPKRVARTIIRLVVADAKNILNNLR